MKNESTDIPKRPLKDDIYSLALVAHPALRPSCSGKEKLGGKKAKTENRDCFSREREEKNLQ